MSRRSALVLAAGILAAVLAGEAAAEPRIDPLTAEWDDGELVVAYEVADGLSEEALERIRSGVEVTLRHRVELVSRRAVPLWPARLLARAEVEARATYDPLTRQYAVTQRCKRRQRQQEEPSVEERLLRTGSVEELRALMTRFPPTRLIDRATAERASRLKLRAESWLGRRYVLLLLPSSIRATAELKLEP